MRKHIRRSGAHREDRMTGAKTEIDPLAGLKVRARCEAVLGPALPFGDKAC